VELEVFYVKYKRSACRDFASMPVHSSVVVESRAHDITLITF